MNKKGFTLIELLAVIVILAIIALIAVPIVLNIIESNRKKAFLQTGNGIIDAAENYYMNSIDGKKPTNNTVFEFKDGEIIVPEEAKDKEVKLEFNGEIPKEGTVTIDPEGKVELVALNENYCITKGFDDKEVTIKDYDGSCTLSNGNDSLVTLDSICKFVNVGIEGKIGAKYQCKVKNNMETGYEDGYYFYILGFNNDGTVNLILDRNVYYNSESDKGLVTDSNDGQVKWNTTGLNTDGPITAMNYLHNATSDWYNVSNVKIDYTDSTNEDIGGYRNIKTDNDITTIKNKTGETTAEFKNLKARLPYYSEVSAYSEAANNGFLYDGLYYWCGYYDDTPGVYQCEGVNTDSNINSSDYWVISSASDDVYFAWRVNWLGVVYSKGSYVNDLAGVRPVITLEI